MEQLQVSLNSLPNCINTPLLRDDNIYTRRLNNLTEKFPKYKIKLKDGHQGSERGCQN